jgi:hypothetical protein
MGTARGGPLGSYLRRSKLEAQTYLLTYSRGDARGSSLQTLQSATTRANAERGVARHAAGLTTSIS